MHGLERGLFYPSYFDSLGPARRFRPVSHTLSVPDPAGRSGKPVSFRGVGDGLDQRTFR